MTTLTIPAAHAIDPADADAFTAYQTAVDSELEKLRPLGNFQKRRNTVWEYAWAAVTPQVAQNSIFERDDVVSKSVFYGKWSKQDEFTAVLERVTAMTRAYVEGKDGRALERRRAELREKETAVALKLIKKADQMLDFPLVTASTTTKSVKDENGREVQVIQTVINPNGKWRQRDAGFLLDRGSTVARRALNMTKDQTDITTGGEPIKTAVQVYLPDNGRD